MREYPHHPKMNRVACNFFLYASEGETCTACADAMSRVGSALILVLSFSLPALAQESRATITGRVTDASAAAVVGARVKATNLQTGVTVAAASNESGAFLLPFLLPGKYRFTAEATGFKTWSQNELELRVNDSIALDVRLEV